MEVEPPGRHRGSDSTVGKHARTDGVLAMVGRLLPALRGVNKVILGTGALAVALVSIWAVLPKNGDVEVHFRGAQVVQMGVPLSRYQQSKPAITPAQFLVSTSQRPAPRGGGQTLQSPGASKPTSQVGAPTLMTTPRTTSATPSTTTPANTTSATTAATSFTKPTTTTLDQSQPRGPSLPAARKGAAAPPPQEYLDSVQREWCLVPECPKVAASVLPIPVPANNQLLPPDQAAAKVAATLSHVRSHDFGQGPDPLGVLVQVKIDLVNTQDAPVTIVWQLDGGPEAPQLSEDWLNSTAVYALRGESAHDSAAFRLWVPIPAQPGDYSISLFALTPDSDLAVDSAVVDGRFR